MPPQRSEQHRLEELAKKLRERFQEVHDEPIPQDIKDLLDQLERIAEKRDKEK